MVHGAALVSACYTTSSGEHYVQFGGHCVLANPIEVGSCLRNNGTYSLQDDLELAARSSPTHEGGSLNEQFRAFVAVPWRCWPLPDVDVDRLLAASRDGTALGLLSVDGNNFRAMGSNRF